MTALSDVEAVLWSQARNLGHRDDLVRKTAMDACLVAVRAYSEDQAGPIVAARRQAAGMADARRARKAVREGRNAS